ncbi:MAG TPA: hypothetical protein VFX97_17565 [Pyrinomonadaceae bacterium]|nr:hypothetical protein [Pyrinomonadaceae bacterium]
MFGSQVIDVAIGMVFVYLLLSLVCSAANELIETVMKNRAAKLEEGIRSLLNDEGLANQVYNHTLVSGLYTKAKGKPSYIPSRTFALALLNIVAPDVTSPGAGSNPVQAVRDTVSNLPANHAAAPIKDALLALIDDAQGDINKLRLNIQNWYDGAMDRVSGWYKRRVHIIIMILGLLVTIGLNVDSIAIFKALANDKALRDSMVAAADAYAKANALPTPTPSPSTTQPPGNSATGAATQPPADSTATPTPVSSPTPTQSPTPSDPCWAHDCQADENSPKCKLKKNQCQLEKLGLPIGWRPPRDPFPGFMLWKPGVLGTWGTQIYEHGWGWLLTALAISLGAPFWFDLLNKFIVIRSTVKPKEKSQEEQSKD